MMTIKSNFNREEEKEVNCSNDCTLSFRNGTSVKIVSTPDDGSAFDGFSGECSGQQEQYWSSYFSTCWLTIDGDKDAASNFEKLELTVTSATCRYNTERGYNYMVIIQGTAT